MPLPGLGHINTWSSISTEGCVGDIPFGENGHLTCHFFTESRRKGLHPRSAVHDLGLLAVRDRHTVADQHPGHGRQRPTAPGRLFRSHDHCSPSRESTSPWKCTCQRTELAETGLETSAITGGGQASGG